MNFKDKLFNGFVFTGFLVVIIIVAAFMFQDILGYEINLFKKEVVEEETTITVIEEETTKVIDYSKLPTLEDMLAEHEREQKEKATKKAEGEIPGLPTETASETEPNKLIISEESPTVITNGEATSIILNPVYDEKGNVSSKNKDLEPETTQKSIKDIEKEKESPTTESNGTKPNTSTGKTLSEVEKMWEKAKAEGGDSSTNTVEILEIGELSGEHTGY